MVRFLGFACLLLLSGCALPSRSVLVVTADTVVCLPPTITVVHTEYRMCGTDVPVEQLQNLKPGNHPVMQLLTFRP